MIGLIGNLWIYSILTLIIVCNVSAQNGNRKVLSPNELNNKKLFPGDIVELRRGEYKNITINIKGVGTAEKPIHIIAANAGDVVFTGNSRIAIQGEFIIVRNFYFSGSEGKKYTGHYPVVRFSGNNCRFTNSVINDYNNNQGIYWIEFKEGNFNRVDHCIFLNKITEAPLIQVWTDENYPNYHRIDHNYFGYRAPLGKNGGELIRIGFSHQMENVSRTLIEKNLFEDFQGEIEIISNKSCENIFRNNTFRRCQGQLTLRHGDRCVVESNFFIGENAQNTRALRIIGSDNIILNNFFKGLTEPAVVFPFGRKYDPHEISYNPMSSDNLLLYNYFVNLNNSCFTTGFPNTELGHTLAPSNITMLDNLFVNDSQNYIFDENTDIDDLNFLENTLTSTYVQDTIFLFDLNKNIIISNFKTEPNILPYELLLRKIENDSVLVKRKSMFYYFYSQEFLSYINVNENSDFETDSKVTYTSPLKLDNVGPKIGPVWLKDAKPQKVTFLNKIYPNPFQNQINFEIQVFKTGKAEMVIQNMSGIFVEKLINRKLEPGIYTISWIPKTTNSQMFIISLLMDGNQICNRKIQYLPN